MPAFAFIGSLVATSAVGISIAATLGISAAVLGSIAAFGAAYITSRVINGNANKRNNSAANEGGRIQVPPATNNKIPVVYGSAYVNGIITDARLISLEQKKNDKMFYCIVLSEYTNNLTTPTYGLEAAYWNDLRLTALDATGNAHIVKDGRKVVDGDIVTAGSFVPAVGSTPAKTYVITKLGTTTQAQWNTIAGTVGETYAIGSIFTCANAGTGTGQAQEEDFIDKNFIVGTNQYVELRVYAGGSSAADQIYPPQSTGNTANAYNFWGSGGTLYPNGDGSWTTGNEMNGLVFAIVSVRYDNTKGFTGLPNMTFKLANNVSNPADVWKDYMTSERYGAGIPAAELDDTARTAWYNFCEEDITYTNVAGETNQATTRYSINGVIDTSNPVKTNIDTIMQNGGAWLSYNVASGLWSPVIKKAVSAGQAGESATYFTASRSGSTLTVTNFPSGRIEVGQLLYDSTDTLIGTVVSQTAPTAGETAGQIGTYTTSTSGTITTTTFYTLPASTLEFDDDNIISGITISSTRLDDLYNAVEVEFYNKYNKDQKAYYRTNLDSADRNPNEPDNQLRMSLDLCNNSMQSDLIGQLELRQSRDDLTIEFTTNQYGIQTQSGDIIAVSSELYGWAPKYFRVMRVKEIETDEGGLIASIQALEYNPDVYTIEPITEFSTSANIKIGVFAASPNLPLPPSVVIAAVDADAPIPSFELQVTVPTEGGPFDEIELYYTEGWDQHAITGSIVPGTGSNGAAIGQGLLTITATTYGNINAGDRIDLATDIFIVSQITNSPASKTFVSGGVPASDPSTSRLITLNNVTGLIVGNTLTGTGIANGSFILEINPAGSPANTVRIEDAVTEQAAGTYTVSGGFGTYIVDTSTTISGTADLYDFPEIDNYKPLKSIVPEGNTGSFTNGQVIRETVTNVPANSATYRRWFVIARMGIKKRFGEFSVAGDVDFEQGRFPYDPNPTAAGALSDLTDVSITSANEGQTLYYDATVSKWKNNSILEVDDTATRGGIVVGAGITQPMITFDRQADGVNAMYGIRGISADTDPWFVGAGSTGTDSGYLEIATGDNTGDPMGDASPIYVRQYNGYSGGASVPWYGGTGAIVNQLTLLDEDGHTIIPNDLTVDGGTLFVDSSVNKVGINNSSPTVALDVTGSVLINDNLTVNGSTTLGNNYIVDQTNVVGQFKVTNNSVDNLFVDKTTGYVGINDNTPSYNLDVNGTANIETSLTVPSITTLTGDDLSITAFSGRGVGIATTSATAVTITRNTAADDDLTNGVIIRHATSNATPLAGIGVGVSFETETAASVFTAGSAIYSISTDVTPSSEDFDLGFYNKSAGTLVQRALLSSVGDLQIDGDLTVTGNYIKSSSATAITLSGADVTVAGDLSVKGTTLTVNSDGTGTEDVTIKVERGATDATIIWNETSGDRWEISNELYTPKATIGVIDINQTSGQIDTNSGSNLTLDSDGGTVLINDNLNVNSGVLYVDAGSNEVGINTTTPTKALDVVGEAKISSEVTIGNSSTFSNVNYQEVRFETYNFNATTGSPTDVGIDLFVKATYRSARYQVTMTKGSAYQVINLTIIHDGTTAYLSQSDDIKTGASDLATFSVSVDATHVILTANINGTVNFKWYRFLTEVN